MREHMGLYRGKRVDTGEWVEGCLYEHEPPLQGVVPKGYTPPPSRWFIVKTAFADWNMPRQVEFIEVDPDTVGECTGLSDKNGKLIFEGDIVRQHGLKWLVGYQRGTFAGLDEKKEMQFAFFEQYDFYKGEYRFPDTFEIIGNIHDTPELLQQEE